MVGNDDNQNIGLDSIPMPGSNLSQSSNSKEVIDSWQRAQNALYSMGNDSSNFGSASSCFPKFTPIYNNASNLYTMTNPLEKNNIPYNYGNPITPNITPNSSVNNFFYNQNQMPLSSPYSKFIYFYL